MTNLGRDILVATLGNATSLLLVPGVCRPVLRVTRADGTVEERELGGIDGWGRSMDVGVDCHDFYPISLEDVIDRLSDQPTPDQALADLLRAQVASLRDAQRRERGARLDYETALDGVQRIKLLAQFMGV